MAPQLQIHDTLPEILSMDFGVNVKIEQQKTSCEQEVMKSIVFIGCGSSISEILAFV